VVKNLLVVLTVGVHRGLALSPLLFVVVMEAVSGEFGVAPQLGLLCADDLAVIAETEEKLIKRLSVWRGVCGEWGHEGRCE